MVLPSSMRLKGHRCFNHLKRKGLRFHSQSMLLSVAKAKPALLQPQKKDQNSCICRCAVAISTKVSKRAVTRNKIRRIIHDHLRSKLEHSQKGAGHWALFILKPNSSQKKMSPLLDECDTLLTKAGFI